MRFFDSLLRKTRETLAVYWQLVRIVVPIMFAAKLLQDLGVVEAVSPALEPIMAAFGLPPELALAWLTGLLVGIWGGLAAAITLVPVADLSVAQVTILSSLLLFAHAIPIEQQIVRKAGPAFVATSALRIGGGLVFAMLLHTITSATGWLSTPAQSSWTPTDTGEGWALFLLDMARSLGVMLLMLLAISWLVELLRITGLLDRINRALAPLFRFAGIESATVSFASVGLLLGISYGSGLIIREARAGGIRPRQVFLACVFMGFGHSIVEDTLVVIAFGADLTVVLVARMAFAIVVTALVARALAGLSDSAFFRFFFVYPGRVARSQATVAASRGPAAVRKAIDAGTSAIAIADQQPHIGIDNGKAVVVPRIGTTRS